MKKSKFSDTQIVSILKEAEAGTPVKEVCRQHQISSACYYKWKSKFGGLSVFELRRNRGPCHGHLGGGQLRYVYAVLHGRSRGQPGCRRDSDPGR